MVKCSPKYLLAQFLEQQEEDGATALIFVGCFSLCLIFTVLQLRVCFFTKFAYVLRSCFSGLKGKQRYP